MYIFTSFVYIQTYYYIDFCFLTRRSYTAAKRLSPMFTHKLHWLGWISNNKLISSFLFSLVYFLLMQLLTNIIAKMLHWFFLCLNRVTQLVFSFPINTVHWNHKVNKVGAADIGSYQLNNIIAPCHVQRDVPRLFWIALNCVSSRV